MEIVMIGNEKGGAGKTTLTRCLSEGLTALGYRVLIVDWDPSGNLSDCTLPDFPDLVLYDVFCGSCTIEQVICKTAIGDVLPTIKELNIGADVDAGAFLLNEKNDKSLTLLANRIFGRSGGERQLKNFLRSGAHDLPNKYDFILIDTGPSDNILVTNAIVASDSVLIACDPDMKSVSGIWKLMSSINTARQCYIGVNAQLDGVVITKYSEEKASFRKSIQQIRQATADQNIYLYETVMRDSGNVSNSMCDCRPLLDFIKYSGNGVNDMINLCLEFLAARGLAPKSQFPGVHQDEKGNWVYIQPHRHSEASN